MERPKEVSVAGGVPSLVRLSLECIDARESRKTVRHINYRDICSIYSVRRRSST